MTISSIIDIVFVALLLVLAIIGLYKGLLKSAISMVGTLASVGVAYVLAKPFSALLEAIFKLTTKLTDKVTDWLHSLSSFFSTVRTGESFGNISGEMAEGGVSGILQKLSNMLLAGVNIPEGESVGSVLGAKIASVIAVVISFIVAFIVFRIVLKILEKLSDRLTDVRILGAVDKTLGFVFGLAKGLVYSAVLVVLFSVVGYFVPAVDTKTDSIVSETKAFQKYYDFINYRVCQYIDDKLGKDSEPEPTAVKVKLADFTAEDLSGVTHAYVIRDGGEVSGAVYFANEELTSKNYVTKGDFFVEYTSAEEYETIMDLVKANAEPITIAYRETAVEKTLDEMVDLFETCSYYHWDLTNKVFYFKVTNAEIDTAQPAFDCDYKITYTEESQKEEIQNAIDYYNTNSPKDIIEVM